ncbi:MAG TPA: RNA polymerase sigma-70 factor [Gemmatimonadaceae bacterium]|nr:RNA polymerase sigma-70 factor [Gemmatimonadaceae bacterium]
MTANASADDYESPDSTHPSAADPQVLEALLREYWAPLVAYAERLLADRSAAEDVVQRGFVRLWQREQRLPPATEVRPFLYRMVRNLVANEWRRSANHERLNELLSCDEGVRMAQSSHELLEAAELERAIELAIESLPPRRREVFVLSRYHGLGNAQIADVLGVSPQTVANQLVGALRTLREVLRDRLDAVPPPRLRIVRTEGE